MLLEQVIEVGGGTPRRRGASEATLVARAGPGDRGRRAPRPARRRSPRRRARIGPRRGVIELLSREEIGYRVQRRRGSATRARALDEQLHEAPPEGTPRRRQPRADDDEQIFFEVSLAEIARRGSESDVTEAMRSATIAERSAPRHAPRRRGAMLAGLFVETGVRGGSGRGRRLRQRAEIVALADAHAVVAEDRVRRREVEEESSARRARGSSRRRSSSFPPSAAG